VSYSTELTTAWWLLVFMLNVAIILPALIILQPIKLLTYLRQQRLASTPRTLFRGKYLHLRFEKGVANIQLRVLRRSLQLSSSPAPSLPSSTRSRSR
jgi:hypothetical protein